MRSIVASWLGGLRAWFPYRVRYERHRWVQPSSEITRAVYSPRPPAVAQTSPATPPPVASTASPAAVESSPAPAQAGSHQRGQAA